MGCDVDADEGLPAIVLVSIHAPAWGATRPGGPKLTPCRCFNPRTRVGCDGQLDGQALLPLGVSIHAPAWGATASARCRAGWTVWFQSTHPRGVRLSVYMQGLSRMWFQSTHPRGVRHEISRDFMSGNQVSIHAPAWGATARSPITSMPSSSFNPRTRVGCDVVYSRSIPDNDAFQSTHPRGVRHLVPAQIRGHGLFQSTHPRGVRPAEKLGLVKPDGFQSTHPTRVRQHGLPRAAVGAIGFNPRTRVGCDGTAGGLRPVRGWVSIHAPAWGATSSTARRASR